MECRTKYDNITFGMFVEVFQHLPLFTIVDEAIFIVHGGLFHCPDVTLRVRYSKMKFYFIILGFKSNQSF